MAARMRTLRVPCGEKNWVFSLFGGHVDPQKVKKPLDLWQRQARSDEALPLLKIELNIYGNF